MSQKKVQSDIPSNISDSLKASNISENTQRMKNVGNGNAVGEHCLDSTFGCRWNEPYLGSCGCSCSRCKTATN